MRHHRSFDPAVEIVSPQTENDNTEIADAIKEVYEDEDKTLRLTALGLLALAVTTGAVAATRHYVKKHKEQ